MCLTSLLPELGLSERLQASRRDLHPPTPPNFTTTRGICRSSASRLPPRGPHDLLVPKKAEENSKCRVWYRLQEKRPLVLLLNCSEVVPKNRHGSHRSSRALVLRMNVFEYGKHDSRDDAKRAQHLEEHNSNVPFFKSRFLQEFDPFG